MVAGRSRGFGLVAVLCLALAVASGACNGGGGGGGGGDDDDDDDGAPTPIDVTLVFVTEADEPMAGVPVLFEGAVYATDSAGSISVTQVLPPYSFAYADPSDPFWLRAWVGLSRPDPVVRLVSGPFRNGTITGTITGATAGSAGTVAFDSPRSQSLAGENSPFFFATTVNWYETPDLDGTLHAFRFLFSDGGTISTITAWGSLDATVEDEAILSDVAIPVEDVAAGTLSTSVSLPPGYTLSRHDAWLVDSGSTPLLLLGSVAGTNGSFASTATPGLDAVVAVDVAALDPTQSRRGLYLRRGPATGALAVDPPAGIGIVAPESGATVTPGSVFELTPVAGASWYTLEMYTKGAGRVLVHSSSASIAFPDLSALGVSIPDGAYLAVGSAVQGPRTIDDLLSGEILLPPDGVTRTGTATIGVTVDSP